MISKEIAKFYALKQQYCDDEYATREEGSRMEWRWLVESLLYPAFKVNFVATEEDMLYNGILSKVTDLKDLYKVFERC